MKKSALVTYPAVLPGCLVQAIILRMHRDGTATVEARFFLDEDGECRFGYLGYRYRLPVSMLSLAS